MEFRIIRRRVRTFKNKVLAWVLELTRGGITLYNADIIRRRADRVRGPALFVSRKNDASSCPDGSCRLARLSLPA